MNAAKQLQESLVQCAYEANNVMITRWWGRAVILNDAGRDCNLQDAPICGMGGRGPLTLNHMDYQRAILGVVEVEQIIVILPLEAVVGVSAKDARESGPEHWGHWPAAMLFAAFCTNVEALAASATTMRQGCHRETQSTTG